MRETNEQITITMNFPYDKPDANGVVYSKEAVKRAIDKGFSRLPLVTLDSRGESRVIGMATDIPPVTIWDDKECVCRCIIDAIIFSGGTECRAVLAEDKTVKEFDIVSLGFATM